MQRRVDSDEQVLRRARDYPYDRPEGAYLFDIATGSIGPLDQVEHLGARLVAGRIAVLAVGSNASPRQLARKFTPDRSSGVIPVIRATLADHDVVHAAQMASYGAVPATLASSPGTLVQVHVTLLDDRQRSRMDRTEGVPHAYVIDRIDPALVECAPPFDGPVIAYGAAKGPLLRDGEPVALAAIHAERRRCPAVTQTEMLDSIAAALGTTGDEMVLAAVQDPDVRARVNALLASWR